MAFRPVVRPLVGPLVLTLTTAALTVLVRSTSLTLKLPLALRLPLVSVLLALLALPAATVRMGASLLPLMRRRSCWLPVKPRWSTTSTVKTSSRVSPTARALTLVLVWLTV